MVLASSEAGVATETIDARHHKVGAPGKLQAIHANLFFFPSSFV
jgi:hypothetical protein